MKEKAFPMMRVCISSMYRNGDFMGRSDYILFRSESHLIVSHLMAWDGAFYMNHDLSMHLKWRFLQN